MQAIRLSVAVVICFSFAVESQAQSTWSWKRWNLFNKDDRYVEPVEITDEATKPRWQNPFADVNLRPRPMEWRTPAFVKRMNENSARAWRNTRRNVGNWATTTGTAIRDSTYDTWDAITRAVTPRPRSSTDDSEAVSPNFGGVNDFLARPKLKF